jgi:chromosome partitioning protein
MRVVSIVNQKGGCGKTTTAVNLAAVLARGGARVMLVDMDPQSHCAAGLGVPEQGLERTIADAMLADGAQPLLADDYMWEVAQGLRLVPSSVSLAAFEAPTGPLAARFDRDRRLARVLAAWQDDFDWCIIDCPPTIGLLTYNALRASDLVMVPVETGFFSLKGAEKQIETIGAVVRRFGRDIPFRLLPTLYNASRPLSRDVVAALGKRFPDALMPVVIGEHEELRDAASYGQSIIEFAPGSAAEADFLALAAWLETNAPESTALRDHVGAPPVVETFRDSAREMFGGNSNLNPSGNAASHAGVTADERAFFSTASSSTGGVALPGTHAVSTSEVGALRADDVSSRATTNGGPSRASDLVSRLRALAERSRQTSPIGAGFGVRTSRDGLVVFSQPASARGLFVVGDFNGWNPVATPLMASADGLRMEAEVELPPGRHAYRIVVDGTEQLDSFNPHRDAAREGIGASLVEVPASVSVAGARSYGSVEGGVR